MSTEYREEIVAKLANDVSKVLECMADAVREKFKGTRVPSFKDFNTIVGEATNTAIKKMLDDTKDEIHKYKITIEELMTAVRKKNPDLVAKAHFNNEDEGTSGGDMAIGNTYVQERCFKITNEDFTLVAKNKRAKGKSALSTVFSDNEITHSWVSALRDDTVMPAFVEMAESYEMAPAAQVTAINHVEEDEDEDEPEHALCKVLTIFEPGLEDPQDSKVEAIIREPIESSKAAIEVHTVRELGVVAVITYVNGLCTEMRYYKISKKCKISKVPCFIADNKEDNDAWLTRLRDRATKEAKNTFLDEVTEAIKNSEFSKLDIDAEDLEEITKLVREKAEKKANEKLKPKEGHSNNRIKFYDN